MTIYSKKSIILGKVKNDSFMWGDASVVPLFYYIPVQMSSKNKIYLTFGVSKIRINMKKGGITYEEQYSFQKGYSVLQRE